MRINQRHLIASLNKGFGLIELMIAMALGLLLMAGVLSLYVSNKQSYKTSEAMGRLQENARYGLYQLQKDIRMAGYADCAPTIINHLNPAGTGYDDTLFNLAQAVGGWEFNAGSGTGPGDSYTITDLSPAGIALSSWDDQDGSDLPASLQNLVVPGTDVFTIKSLGAIEGISVKSNNNINSNSINSNGANGVPQSTILLVTQDCFSADLFQKMNNGSAASLSKGNGSPNPGNTNSPTPPLVGAKKWSAKYGPGAKFIAFKSTLYFIGMDADEIPSLYRVSFDSGVAGAPEKIVDGVENMQVLYGEDTDATADRIANIYRTIDTIADPERITSVRLSLLMRTLDAVAAEVDTKTDYKMAGHSSATATSIDPINDRFLRYVFTTTVKLRNRGSL